MKAVERIDLLRELEFGNAHEDTGVAQLKRAGSLLEGAKQTKQYNFWTGTGYVVSTCQPWSSTHRGH